MRPTILDTAKRCSIDGHADEGIFYTQHQLSLLDKKQAPFLSLARLVPMTHAHQQADIVYHIATPPPPNLKSLSIDKRSGSETRPLGNRRWKVFTPHALQGSPHIYENTGSSLIPLDENSQTESLSIAEKAFLPIFVVYTSHKSRIILPKPPIFQDLPRLQRTASSYQAYIGRADVQTYPHPIIILIGGDNRRVTYRIVFLVGTSGEPILWGTQKKGGEPSEPGKQKPDEQEPENPGRGGTKKVQRVKRSKKGIGISNPPKKQQTDS